MCSHCTKPCTLPEFSLRVFCFSSVLSQRDTKLHHFSSSFVVLFRKPWRGGLGGGRGPPGDRRLSLHRMTPKALERNFWTDGTYLYHSNGPFTSFINNKMCVVYFLSSKVNTTHLHCAWTLHVLPWAGRWPHGSAGPLPLHLGGSWPHASTSFPRWPRPRAVHLG